jgi:hypothetical protein
MTCDPSAPRISAPPDSGFAPAVLFNRADRDKVRASGKGVPLVLGLERENGLVSRYETVVHPDADAITLRYVERIVKFLIESRGGWIDFHDYAHMLILGRVTTGKRGDIVIDKAREVLAGEFPETAAKIAMHVPDEKTRRVGQAVAAASLPKLR